MSLVAAITDYIEAWEPKEFFPRWSRTSLCDYIDFHLGQQTIGVARVESKISGVLIGWRQQEAKPAKWTWQKSDPTGAWWWFDQFFANDPISAAVAGAALIQQHPEANQLPAAGMRHGRVRIYKPGQALLIWRKAANLWAAK